MKKYIKVILACLLLGISVGFIDTYLLYEGYWAHFNKGLNSVYGWVHIIYALAALFVAILAHESGHFISFKRHGIKPKAIYILGIAFVDDHGWKIRFVPKFLLLIGGIVIPEHIQIHDETTEKDIVEKFKKVLLAGPKASIIYGVIIFILWVLCLFTPIYWLSGFLFTTMIVTTLMSVVAVLASRVSKGGMYGDFAAEKAFDKDPLFRLTYLIQLTTLIEHDQESMDYFWPKIVHTLEKKYLPGNHLYNNLLGQYIYEVVFEGRIASTGVDRRIQSILNRLSKNEDGLIMYLNIVYYYEAMSDRMKTLDLLNKLDTSQYKVPDKILTYYLRLTNHLLNFKDETEFLNNPRNIQTSSINWVYKPLRLKDEIKDIKK